mmetsp:Transcript_23837/g.41014  ORF Transcript_23837/g.41014 Transcript_23837/m.41014 type:complete len:255 (-) Transcript_23837:358-1122(-)
MASVGVGVGVSNPLQSRSVKPSSESECHLLRIGVSPHLQSRSAKTSPRSSQLLLCDGPSDGLSRSRSVTSSESECHIICAGHPSCLSVTGPILKKFFTPGWPQPIFKVGGSNRLQSRSRSVTSSGSACHIIFRVSRFTTPSCFSISYPFLKSFFRPGFVLIFVSQIFSRRSMAFNKASGVVERYIIPSDTYSGPGMKASARASFNSSTSLMVARWPKILYSAGRVSTLKSVNFLYSSYCASLHSFMFANGSCSP